MNVSMIEAVGTTQNPDFDVARLMAGLRRILATDSLLVEQEDLVPYECDGLTAYRQLPLLVALPQTEAQVVAVLKLCHELRVPVVARGAGTGLSGGATPVKHGVVLSLAKFMRILDIDSVSRTARVQPGVRNLSISEAVAPYGLYYAPDPSSQIACTIGGNVAENSGGVHCLKYGLTVHNVLSVRVALIDGTVVEIGSGALDSPGYDLLALMIGSEGMLGIVLEATVKLTPKPLLAQVVMASFDDVVKAGNAVADIISAGIIPAGLEMMDKPATHAVEDFVHAGYDLNAQAILLAESDGTPEEVAEEIAAMCAVLEKSGATDIRVSQNEAERLKFWAGRKAAFPAVGRITPDYLCMDGTIPRKASRPCADAHRRTVGGISFALRQRLPRRRRQPAPAHHVRRQRRGRGGARHGLRRQDPRTLRGGRRHHYRRARRRHREGEPDVRAVLEGGAGGLSWRQGGFRRTHPAQSRQGRADAAALLGI